MEYVRMKKDFQIQEPTVVTIGKFDGRHRGHQKLLGEMVDIKKKKQDGRLLCLPSVKRRGQL